MEHIKNFQELFSLDDFKIAQNAHNTYDCGRSPIALYNPHNDDYFYDYFTYDSTHYSGELVFYPTKLFYAIEVWKKATWLTIHKDKQLSLYWCSHWKNNETPFRDLIFDYNNEDKDNEVIKSFWQLLENIANTRNIFVSDGLYIDTRRDDRWKNDRMRVKSIVVCDKDKYNNLEQQKFTLDEFPFDTTRVTFSWNEIKQYFIHLTTNQLRLTMPQHLHQYEDIDGELFRACYNLDIEGVKIALEHGANVNAIDSIGSTPLAEVIKNRDISEYYKDDDGWEDKNTNAKEIINLLLANGADIDLFGYEGIYPLGETYYSHSFQLAKYLLEKGANPNYNCYFTEQGEERFCSTALSLIYDSLGEEYDETLEKMEKILLQYGAKLLNNDERK